MPYIGRPLNAGNLAVQSGTGDGSDTTPIATLDYSVGSSNSIGVYLDGVRQLAGTDFTASGTTLTFTTAPANGVGIDVYFLGLELSIPTPADATVAKAKITTTLINEHVDTTITAADSILFSDATDSNANKKDTVQGILDLVPAHTGNVAFPASQSASADANTLDDYEEGTWTPVLTDLTNNATSSFAVGFYTKIGKVVFVNLRIGTSSLGSVSGSVYISGLPFTTSNTANNIGSVHASVGAGLAITASTTVSGAFQQNTTQIQMFNWDVTTGNSSLQGTEWTADGAIIMGGHYFV